MNVLMLLLAAAPVAQVPPPPAPDPLTTLYVLIGTQTALMLLGAIGLIIRWLAVRTVEREDKDKADLREQIEAHEDKFQKLERTLYDLNHVLSRVESDGKNHHSTVEGIRGIITEVKTSVESGRDKQAEAHRTQMKEVLATVNEKLEKLEFQIRQDTTRAIHDAKILRGG